MQTWEYLKIQSLWLCPCPDKIEDLKPKDKVLPHWYQKSLSLAVSDTRTIEGRPPQQLLPHSAHLDLHGGGCGERKQDRIKTINKAKQRIGGSFVTERGAWLRIQWNLLLKCNSLLCKIPWGIGLLSNCFSNITVWPQSHKLMILVAVRKAG